MPTINEITSSLVRIALYKAAQQVPFIWPIKKDLFFHIQILTSLPVKNDTYGDKWFKIIVKGSPITYFRFYFKEGFDWNKWNFFSMMPYHPNSSPGTHLYISIRDAETLLELQNPLDTGTDALQKISGMALN